MALGSRWAEGDSGVVRRIPAGFSVEAIRTAQRSTVSAGIAKFRTRKLALKRWLAERSEVAA